MSEGVRGRVLVVCAANVCRSPFAAFLLGRSLPDVDVANVGVSARAGDPLCRFTKERIDQLPGGSEFTSAHVVTRLDVESIDRADLILTASEAERSAVAMLAPASRPKTFTLIEAAFSARELAPVPLEQTLGELAARMHAQRGIVALPQARPRRWYAPLRPNFGIAVPDAHIGDTRKHEDVYRAVSDAVDMFVGAWAKARLAVDATD